MSILQAMSIAFGALRANKMRSALTMLGVIIGVFSVVTLVSIGQGATSSVTEQIQGMGSNLITVTITGRGVNRFISLKEAEQLADRAGVAAIAPVVSQSATVKQGNQSVTVAVEGATVDYTAVRNHPIARGRFISAADISIRQNIVVLGSDTAQDLFPFSNPLGQDIRINGIPFTVVGVLAEKGSSMGGSSDEKAIIPITTALRTFHIEGIQTVYIEAENADVVDSVISSLEASLQYHFRDEDAVRIFSQTQILDTMNQVTNTLTLMLGGIAAISLLVGGIGIMNIMLVSVTERTREIGICKALGAKKRDILLQFLIESAVLSGLGGIVGMVFGYLAVTAIRTYSGLGAVFSLQIVLIAIIFSLCIGVFFGIYPANRAARLNPIEALRAQ
jgi:putative ABC transport system permease protein